MQMSQIFILLLSNIIIYSKFAWGAATNVNIFDGGGIVDFIEQDFFFEIIEPKELSFTFKIRPAKDFGLPFNQSFSAQGVRLVPVDPPCGCGWPRNAEDLEGSVALLERGECSFTSKTVKAEEVGAIAVVISDSDISSDEYFIEMVDDSTGRESNIPAGFLLGKNGFVIRDTLRKLEKRHAIINLPSNLTNVPISKLNQPPWVIW